jgi:hypothetical protein
MSKLLEYVYDDGGRSKYFKGETRDCVCRAISIVSGRDYKEIYNLIKKTMGESPRNGVRTNTKAFQSLMNGLGFTYIKCYKDKLEFVDGALPDRAICYVYHHYVAVVNNVVRDTWDSRYNSFNEPRKIYGYWVYNR